MTTHDPERPQRLSDPRVDAAWRAASDEEPPQAVDRAILAAARREARAGPQRSAAARVAARRRWWPVAAAATIGAIVVGVVQQLPPNELVAPAGEHAAISEAPRSLPAPPQIAATAPREAAVAARTAPLAKVAAEGTAADGAAPARAASPPTLPVAEWIALIRKLRADGRLDDAARELVAFRTAHPDHERLLPPDLRDWRPPQK